MDEYPPTPEVAAPVAISADTVQLQGELALPARAKGVVLFAHGSGSSRHSPRNTYVAGVLREAGLGTLLFDLLTTAEDRDYATRFDIALLTSRLVAATRWILRETSATALPIGYFGASTGAAAALAALVPEQHRQAGTGGGPDRDAAEDPAE